MDPEHPHTLEGDMSPWIRKEPAIDKVVRMIKMTLRHISKTQNNQEHQIARLKEHLGMDEEARPET